MSNETWLLQRGEQAYHLRSGRWGAVLHISPRRSSVLLCHADGTIRAYPVDALRVRNAIDGEPTMRCEVSE